MQLLAVPRAISAVLLGGTLVSFVPAVESPSSAAAALSPVAPSAEPDSCDWPAVPPDDDDAIDALTRFVREPAETARGPAVAQLETKPKEYVKAKVFLSLDKLPAGGKVKFIVILDVQKGWHINANPPHPDNMIPTKVTVAGKHKSKQLATTYPEGSELTVKEIDEAVSVYEGQVEIRGEIQAPNEAVGKTEELEFQVKYQACNEKNCLPPKTLKLGGKIEIVKPGTPVKQINQKYFSDTNEPRTK
jgi:hypothetical protein